VSVSATALPNLVSPVYRVMWVVAVVAKRPFEPFSKTNTLPDRR